MVVILVLALLDKSLVRKILVNKPAIMKVVHTIKETLSLAKMDVILVLVLLVRFLVQRWPVDQILANMKVTHTMKEIPSLAKMDATVVLALLDRSIVQKMHVMTR
jgi:hypothetical protein